MAELSGVQWKEWLDYFDLFPSGSFHDELRWGLLISSVLNSQMGRKKAVQAEEVLPSLARLAGGGTAELSAEEQAARWRVAAAASGGCRR